MIVALHTQIKPVTAQAWFPDPAFHLSLGSPALVLQKGKYLLSHILKRVKEGESFPQTLLWHLVSQ